MNWQPVRNRNDMPFDRIFLSMWKGRICLTRYDEDDNHFWICWDPADNGFVRVFHGRENKFTYWMDLPKEKHEDNE